MLWMSLVASALVAAEPCEPPRVRDTAPLAAAMAQDKVMGLTFSKTAGICGERGEGCDQVRLECATFLASTIQKQVGFDEGQWLRDMLLPYNGANYPVSRTFGAAAIASDASCNVDVATLTASGQRRLAQAARRDTIFQEYALYTRWAQAQLQKCKERAAGDEVKSAAARAESERLAAASAAVGAAEAIKLKQAQDAAQARTDAEKRAREAADAEVQKQKDLKTQAEKEAQKRDEAEQRARDERDRDRKLAEEKAQKLEADRKEEKLDAEAARKKEKEEAEARVKQAAEEAEQKQREAETKKFVTERDTRVAQQRATKERLVKDAEENFKRAKDEEALKKQAAVDAVSSSPAIAQAAVAEAAQAEKARVAAEKNLFDAKQKADSIVIDDSFERSAGSLLIAGGASAVDTGFGLGVLGGAHLGFWGTAPPEGLASGFELRLWGRYFGTVSGAPSSAVDMLLTGRYFFGAVAVGLAGELRLLDPALSTLRGGVGPALAAAFVDTNEMRVLLGVNYLPVGNTIDALRFVGDFEVSWRFLTFHVIGGTASKAAGGLAWQIGGYAGVRASW